MFRVHGVLGLLPSTGKKRKAEEEEEEKRGGKDSPLCGCRAAQCEALSTSTTPASSNPLRPSQDSRKQPQPIALKMGWQLQQGERVTTGGDQSEHAALQTTGIHSSAGQRAVPWHVHCTCAIAMWPKFLKSAGLFPMPTVSYYQKCMVEAAEKTRHPHPLWLRLPASLFTANPRSSEILGASLAPRKPTKKSIMRNRVHLYVKPWLVLGFKKWSRGHWSQVKMMWTHKPGFLFT